MLPNDILPAYFQKLVNPVYWSQLDVDISYQLASSSTGQINVKGDRIIFTVEILFPYNLTDDFTIKGNLDQVAANDFRNLAQSDTTSEIISMVYDSSIGKHVGVVSFDLNVTENITPELLVTPLEFRLRLLTLDDEFIRLSAPAYIKLGQSVFTTNMFNSVRHSVTADDGESVFVWEDRRLVGSTLRSQVWVESFQTTPNDDWFFVGFDVVQAALIGGGGGGGVGLSNQFTGVVRDGSDGCNGQVSLFDIPASLLLGDIVFEIDPGAAGSGAFVQWDGTDGGSFSDTPPTSGKTTTFNIRQNNTLVMSNSVDGGGAGTSWSWQYVSGQYQPVLINSGCSGGGNPQQVWLPGNFNMASPPQPLRPPSPNLTQYHGEGGEDGGRVIINDLQPSEGWDGITGMVALKLVTSFRIIHSTP